MSATSARAPGVLPHLRIHLASAVFWGSALAAQLLWELIGMPALLLSAALLVFWHAVIVQGSNRTSMRLHYSLEQLEAEVISAAFAGEVMHVCLEIHLPRPGSTVRAHALHVRSQSRGAAVPTLLLLHGNGATAACWADCFEPLSQSFDVLALDLPGFARSECAEHLATTDADSIIRFYAEYIHCFLSAVGLHKVAVLAHSYGAFLAIHFADLFPQHVSHLLLADAAGIFPTLGATGAYWAFAFKASLLHVVRSWDGMGAWACHTWLAHYECGPAHYYWYAVLSAPSGWGDRKLAEFITLGWSRCCWNRPAFDRLVEVSRHVPVATVYGALDAIIPAEQGRVLERSAVFCQS